MKEIKTLDEAIETLNEVGDLLNEAEDRIGEEANSYVETAYIEVSNVLYYLKQLKKGERMDTVFETRDVLLALSHYMEHVKHTDERMKELQKLFEKIANDGIVLIKKGEK